MVPVLMIWPLIISPMLMSAHRFRIETANVNHQTTGLLAALSLRWHSCISYAIIATIVVCRGGLCVPTGRIPCGAIKVAQAVRVWTGQVTQGARGGAAGLRACRHDVDEHGNPRGMGVG